MKTYKANQELENILLILNQGFIEVTSERDKFKGKKAFRLSQKSRKEVYFDYINIRVNSRGSVHDSLLEIDEEGLKLLLIYFKLPDNDSKEIIRFNTFKFSEAKERIKSLQEELRRLIEYNFRKPRQEKIKRILDYYDDLKFDYNTL
jgi:hypothetical protein